MIRAWKKDVMTKSDLEELHSNFLLRRSRPEYKRGPDWIGVVDLFCGCGGMTLGLAEGLRQIGKTMQVRLALDTDADAIRVFKKNFPESLCVLADVRDWFDGRLGESLTENEERLQNIYDGEIDVLLGGPPCQGNSDLNNHTRRNDDRNALYGIMARAAAVFEPKIVIIENVPAVIHDRNGIVDSTVRVLQKNEYEVEHELVDVDGLGLPQNRRRHILLAVKHERTKPAHIFQSLRESESLDCDVRWAIEDLESTNGSEFNSPSHPSPTNLERMQWLVENEEHDLPDELRPPCHQDGNHSYNSVYGQLRWDRPAQTITTGFGSMGQGRYVHPSHPRTITPHEAARLQFFPDFFSFDSTSKRSAWARMIGNAVPPLLTLRLILEMQEILERSYRVERGVKRV